MEILQADPVTPLYRDLDADQALSRLHREHYLTLVRIAVALVDSRASAEDVVQQAYVDVLRRWPSVRLADDVPAYLRRAVLNGARDRLRRRRVRRAYVAPHAVPAAAAEELALLSVEHRAVIDALRQLPERQREVLVLRHLADMSEADTAAALGITTSAAKSAAHRGVAALKARLQNGELS